MYTTNDFQLWIWAQLRKTHKIAFIAQLVGCDRVEGIMGPKKKIDR